jgi:CorA-like Mg2+ transporter protein
MAALSREIYGRMVTLERFVPGASKALVADLADQFARVSGLADGQKDFLQGVIEFYQTRTNTKMTIAAERLAVIAAVTLPITALSSIYGMNVIVNDRTHPVHLAVVLLVMAAMSLVLLRWTKRQGWWCPSRGQGARSWARIRARARRSSRETCIWEWPILAAIAFWFRSGWNRMTLVGREGDGRGHQALLRTGRPRDPGGRPAQPLPGACPAWMHGNPDDLAAYPSPRTAAAILRTRSGSAIASISTILPSVTVKPRTAKGRPSTVTTTPAAPFTSAGCRWAVGSAPMSACLATAAAPRVTLGAAGRLAPKSDRRTTSGSSRETRVSKSPPRAARKKASTTAR